MSLWNTAFRTIWISTKRNTLNIFIRIKDSTANFSLIIRSRGYPWEFYYVIVLSSKVCLFLFQVLSMNVLQLYKHIHILDVRAKFMIHISWQDLRSLFDLVVRIRNSTNSTIKINLILGHFFRSGGKWQD